jgi:hypothetical protein
MEVLALFASDTMFNQFLQVTMQGWTEVFYPAAATGTDGAEWRKRYVELSGPYLKWFPKAFPRNKESLNVVLELQVRWSQRG